MNRCFMNSCGEILGMSGPNKDGVETAKEILKINTNVKIIFASADIAVRNAALNSGACSFLSRPFAMSDLLAGIEEIVAEC